VKVKDANNLYNYLAQNEVVVRNRSKDVLCDNCLRITIGTPEENSQLLILLKQYEQQSAN
jgi:histidinol-phosphate aminotransferase